MDTLADIVTSRRELSEKLQLLKERYESKKNQISREILEIERKLKMAKNGLDLTKIEIAKNVISIRGSVLSVKSCGTFQEVSEIPKRLAVVDDAINDIANGVVSLRVEFFGTKNYSGWSDQRSDHGYGCGPRHGSIVFSVGIVRSRLHDEFSKDEIDAAIYALMNIKELHKVQYAS